MLIIDAHEDLAFNTLTLGRDYTISALETRLQEQDQDSETSKHGGECLLGWPEYQAGTVVVVFSTLFAAPSRRRLGPWDSHTYQDSEQAHRLYRAQADVYRQLTEDHPEKFRLIPDRRTLDELLALWEVKGGNEQAHVPVGLVMLMEGAEGVRHPEELELWWDLGVRLIGPAWAGTRFCGGTGEPGPLTKEGYALLDAMASIGFTLDLSHMDEQAALQALDDYPGPIIASHANAATLLEGAETNRHLTDAVIRRLIERNGVIGVVPFNKFLLPGWKKADGRQAVTLSAVVAQIDYVCQMAGDARHAGFGSDFDGGFGRESVPEGLDTIADLQKIGPLLASKGYSEADVADIFSRNWRRHLQNSLPETT